MQKADGILPIYLLKNNVAHKATKPYNPFNVLIRLLIGYLLITFVIKFSFR